jgi:hypothetical protein
VVALECSDIGEAGSVKEAGELAESEEDECTESLIV